MPSTHSNGIGLFALARTAELLSATHNQDTLDHHTTKQTQSTHMTPHDNLPHS